jgi:hypothetical protein
MSRLQADKGGRRWQFRQCSRRNISSGARPRNNVRSKQSRSIMPVRKGSRTNPKILEFCSTACDQRSMVLGSSVPTEAKGLGIVSLFRKRARFFWNDDYSHIARVVVNAGKPLLQLRVLRFGFCQDGDVGVGVFPKGEEILIGRLRFGSVALQNVGTGQAQMRHHSGGAVSD